MAGSFQEVDKDGNKKIMCEVCGRYFHQLSVHLSKKHGMSVDEYKQQYDGAPTISEWASQQVSDAQKKAQRNVFRPREVVQNMVSTETDNKDWAGKRLAFGAANLVIRNIAELSETEQKFVPAHDANYHVDGELAEQLALGIEQGDNVMMIGPTGCGKTTLAQEIATLITQPVRRANLHGDVRSSDFVGEKVVEIDPATGESVIVWKDGILPEAMRNGYWLLLDEVDAAPPQILFVLQAVLDSGKLILTANHGEVVDPDPNFRIITTANTTGRGDDSGLYAGTNILNEAFLDRFGTVIKHSYMPEKVEAKVIERKTGVDANTAAKMVEVAVFVRNGFDNEECYCTLSTRKLIGWGRKVAAIGIHKAAQVAVLNKLNREDAEYVGGIIQRVFGN